MPSPSGATVLETIVIPAGQGGGGGSGWSDGFITFGLGGDWFSDVTSSAWAQAVGLEWAMLQYLDYTNTQGFTIDWLEGVSQLSPADMMTSLIHYANADLWAEYGDILPVAIAAGDTPVSPEYQPDDYKMSGGILAPVTALAHYLFGDGEDLRVDLYDTQLLLQTHEIPAIAGLIASGTIGATQVDSDFVYNTAEDSMSTGAYLGQITLTVEGEFVRSSSTQWSFNGEVRAYSDRYDANAMADRTPIAELSTAILAALQGITGAQEYEIHFDGSIPVYFDQDHLMNDYLLRAHEQNQGLNTTARAATEVEWQYISEQEKMDAAILEIVDVPSFDLDFAT